eukprot:Clim_evm39s136 gene=Clim_evmTU39s136
MARRSGRAASAAANEKVQAQTRPRPKRSASRTAEAESDSKASAGPPAKRQKNEPATGDPWEPISAAWTPQVELVALKAIVALRPLGSQQKEAMDEILKAVKTVEKSMNLKQVQAWLNSLFNMDALQEKALEYEKTIAANKEQAKGEADEETDEVDHLKPPEDDEEEEKVGRSSRKSPRGQSPNEKKEPDADERQPSARGRPGRAAAKSTPQSGRKRGRGRGRGRGR